MADGLLIAFTENLTQAPSAELCVGKSVRSLYGLVSLAVKTKQGMPPLKTPFCA